MEPMDTQEPDAEGAAITECIGEIADFVATLVRYPPNVLAAGMGANLQCVLRCILDAGLSTRSLISEFLEVLTREVLKPERLDS